MEVKESEIKECIYMQLFLDLKYEGECIYQILMTHCIVFLNLRSLCVLFKLRNILFRSDSLCNSLIVMGTVCKIWRISTSFHAFLLYGESSCVCVSALPQQHRRMVTFSTSEGCT